MSQVAASNYPAGSDSPANLDDVQRAHASFIAQLRDDRVTRAEAQTQTYTAFTAAGTSTAYTLTTSPAAGALAENERYQVEWHTTSGAAPTMARDGLTAKNLMVYNSAGAKVAPATGALVAGVKNDVVYDGTDYVVLDPLPSSIAAATTAEIKTGTNSTSFIAPDKLLAAQGFTAYFESAAQTISQAGSLTIAHGLGRKPVHFQTIIKCTTGDMSYSVGDELVIPVWYGSGVSFHGCSIVPDATNLVVKFVNAATVYYIADKSSGNAGTIVNGSWKLYIRCWA